MNNILTCIRQGVMVAWVDALGARHPWDWGGRCWRAQAGQTFATCNGTEAALPLAMVLTLTRGLFGATSASDTFLEHWITFNIQLVVPAPRWFRQGNIPWQVEASKSLMVAYKPRYGSTIISIAVARFTVGRLPARRDREVHKQNLARQLEETILLVSIYCIS